MSTLNSREKANMLKVKDAMVCYTITLVVLSISYLFEVLKHNRTLLYTIVLLLLAWIPYTITTILNIKVFKKMNLGIRYCIVYGYMLLYIFALFTTVTYATYVYIMPIICIALMFNNVKFIDSVNLAVILINLIEISVMVIVKNNEITPEVITGFEIQMAMIILCSVYLHKKGNQDYYDTKELDNLSENINIDILTGAYTRYYMTNKLKDKPILSNNYSLAIVDIDNFKQINDTYGHKIGDLVLRTVTAIMKKTASTKCETDVVRLGGDEFVILSSCMDKTEMYELCKNICKSIDDKTITINSDIIDITVSIGVADSNDYNCKTFDNLYEAADQMLYTVKNTNKNSVSVTLD